MQPVVSPRADLHRTGLVVEWKVTNIDVTSGSKHTSRLPMHATVVIHQYTHLTEIGRQLFGATTHPKYL